MSDTTKPKGEPKAAFDVEAYLAPLMSMDPKDSIRIAEFLAIELTVLRVGIEKLHADVAALTACVARIESRLP